MERGREVTPDEVIPYAKVGCSMCGGAGYYGIRRPDRQGNGAKETNVCLCAVKRFVKEHEVVHDEQTGKFYWPAEVPAAE